MVLSVLFIGGHRMGPGVVPCTEGSALVLFDGHSSLNRMSLASDFAVFLNPE